MLIQERIKIIMQSNRETASTFADKIGVKRSNLSHVLSGRNKPSLDFLEKIINFYPNVNASWLVTGKTRNGDFQGDDTNVKSSKKEDLQSEVNQVKDSGVTRKSESIEKVIVFYTNGEIKEYN